MNSVRTMIRGEYAGMTCTVGGSGRFGGSSGTPTAESFQPARRIPFPGAADRSAARGSEGPQQVRPQAGDSEDAGTGVGADHRADLGDQLGVAAEDRAPAVCQALGLADRLHVLDREAVAAVA